MNVHVVCILYCGGIGIVWLRLQVLWSLKYRYSLAKIPGAWRSLYLFEYSQVEELLELLVAVVDAELLKTVRLEIL